MPNRPLVLVCGLTFGDYMLWNWSLNSNHDVLALVSGLTLPPLGVVCLWLLALSLARLLARSARRQHRLRRLTGRPDSSAEVRHSRHPTSPSAPLEGAAANPAATTPSARGGRSPGKLAA